MNGIVGYLQRLDITSVTISADGKAAVLRGSSEHEFTTADEFLQRMGSPHQVVSLKTVQRYIAEELDQQIPDLDKLKKYSGRLAELLTELG